MKELLTKRRLQDACLAQGWPQTTPKQSAYKNKRFKKKLNGYTLHIGDSVEQSPLAATPAHPGQPSCQGSSGPVTVGQAGQLKVELVLLAP